MREYIRHIRTEKRKQLEEKTKELLWPFKQSHPITYNPRYIRGVCASLEDTSDVEDEALSFGKIARAKYSEGEYLAAADAMDEAEIFYEVSYPFALAFIFMRDQTLASLVQRLILGQIAMDRFIDEMATLGVERCLLHDLPSIIPLRDASTIDDEKVSRIAAETPEVRQKRAKAQAQVAALEEALRTFQTYSDHAPGMYMK